LPDIVFEATSAYVHVRNAPEVPRAGIRAVDLTPAARALRGAAGQPHRAPRRDERQHGDLRRSGDHPDGPRRVADGPGAYAEIVATVSSASAGPGTRQNIDEFTRTTAKAVEVIGGATAGQGDHHPQPGRAAADDARHHLLLDPARRRHGGDRERRSTRSPPRSQTYVPGYRLVADPQFDVPFGETGMGRVAVFLEVEGAATSCRPTPATSTS
jgi:acetaldehyde dehydrogenase